MLETLTEFVVAERNWLPVAILLAAVAALSSRRLPGGLPRRSVHGVFLALALFFATMIGVMAGGHFLAVTILQVSGALSRPGAFLYAIGALTAAPALTLAVVALRARRSERLTPGLMAAHLWLGATLLALGLHNAPIAAPAFANLAYRQASNPLVRRTILGVIVLGYVGLFIGSVVFMASGQSFEEFSGQP